MKKRDIAVQFKSTIKLLLARCYKELGEPEMEQKNFTPGPHRQPENLKARLG